MALTKELKPKQYVVLKAGSPEILEQEINNMANQGYALHSSYFMDTYGGKLVAVMELPLITVEVAKSNPVLDWWESLSQETAMELAAKYDIRFGR